MDAKDAAADLGLLVVGVGWLGSRRAAACVAARGTRLVAVCDADGLAAGRVADRHGVLAAPDFASGLRLPGVDAVLIATPPADHARLIRRALEAGKHVLCEKPLTVEPYDARLLAGLADERGLRLATGFNHRFYPPIAEARKLVEAGAIGRVISVRAEIGHRASFPFLTSWHVDVARAGGGTLMDNGPHACDLIRGFAGEVVAAKGYVASSLDLPEGCESEAFALFRCQDSAVAELRSSWTLRRGYLTIEAHGSEGYLRVEAAPWRLTGRLAGGRRLGLGYLPERLREAAYRRLHGCERSLVWELEAFASAVRERRGPGVGASGWDGCRATEMIHAAYRAAETGEEVLLDPLPILTPGARRALQPWEVA
jgi:predicted dehydrogenase